MPRYFFDTMTALGLARDSAGTEIADDEAACRHGLDALPGLLRDGPSDGVTRACTIVVRDDRRRPILLAEVNLKARWLR